MTRKEWLIATILTFITLCAWVISDIIHARAKVEIPQELQKIIEPINPNLNTKSIETE